MLFLALSANRSFGQTDDRYLAVGMSDNYSGLLVDTKSVSGTTAWVITVSPITIYYTSDKFYYNYDYSRVQFDCEGRKYKTVSLDQRDANGKSLWSKDNLDWDWTNIEPDTLYEDALGYVCGHGEIRVLKILGLA